MASQRDEYLLAGAMIRAPRPPTSVVPAPRPLEAPAAPEAVVQAKGHVPRAPVVPTAIVVQAKGNVPRAPVVPPAIVQAKANVPRAPVVPAAIVQAKASVPRVAVVPAAIVQPKSATPRAPVVPVAIVQAKANVPRGPAPCGGDVGSRVTAQPKIGGPAMSRLAHRTAASSAGQAGVVQRVTYDLRYNTNSNKQRMTSLDQALSDLHAALTGAGLTYAVQGSMAQAMHGAGLMEVPGDIDVLVRGVAGAARAAIASTNFKNEQPGPLVYKVKHIATGIIVDIVDGEDFGMNNVTTTQIDGRSVLSIFDTLLSLLTRPGRRLKDHISFISLLVPKADMLTVTQKEILARTAGMSWQQLYDAATTEYRSVVMG